MNTPLSQVLEFTRETDADKPYDFQFRSQRYIHHIPGGGVKTFEISWDNQLLTDLDNLRQPGCDPGVVQRLGNFLAQTLQPIGWRELGKQIEATCAKGQPVVVTFRFNAAELYVLPWELLVVGPSGQHLGALPGVTVRYEWPQTHTTVESSARRQRGRVLFAWSAAGGPVPHEAHQRTLSKAWTAGEMGVEPVVLAHATARQIRAKLAEAESRGEPFEYLHLLAHGGQVGSSFGLLLDRDEGDSSGIDPGRLRQLLGPFASTLRVIVVAACDSGNVGEIGNQLGSVAQALHRVGFRAVVASRFALSTAGSEVLAEAFYQAHIVDKLSVEQAVARARVRLAEATGNLDWASLQLYARAADDVAAELGTQAETDLFLSYRFHLRDQVELLVEALERAGVRVWRDVDELRSGDAITDKLRKALARTRALAVLATEDYFDSEVCAWELASAWSTAARKSEADKRILLLNPGDHESLARIQVGPLKDSLAFNVPAGISDLDNFAQDIAEHLKQVDASPLGAATSFSSPKFHPTRQTGSNRFIGRMAKLWELHGMLLQSRVVGVTGKVGNDVAQVRGLGGIGKTLLAIEYSRRFDTAWPGGIFWIDAAATSTSDRRTFLANIAALIRVTPTGDLNKTATLVENKIAELTGDKPYLWILDNVSDGTTKDAIEIQMPPSANGSVLLTTRWFALDYLGEMLDLGVLDPEPAFQLLTQAHEPVGEDEVAAAREITKLVGYHPLALDVLRALVKNDSGYTETPYQEWLKELKDPSADHLDAAAEDLREVLPTNTARAISAVLARSLDACSKRALDVLRVASVLAPEAIPGKLFTGILRRCDGINVRKTKRAVGELESLALARRVPDQSFDVHALVRRVVTYTRSTQERLDELAEVARAELVARLEDVLDIRRLGRLQPFVAHAENCADANTLEAANVGVLLGIYFYFRGDYPSARERYERALVAYERILGPEHPDTLGTLQNLAGALKAQGDLTGARERNERALAARERILGSEHPDTLMTLQNLAGILEAQGDLTGARERYERALVAYERILGPEHSDTLMTLQNLAGTLKAQGDLTGARERYERALAARERILGPEHPDTLMTLQNLAATLKAQGDLSGAREREERVLAARERILGPEHPDTLMTLQNLAGTLYAQGDLTGAREREERALAARERILGLEHPDTLGTLQNLAVTLKAQGDLTGARERYERALAAYERILGPEHPDTLMTLQNLAITLKAQGHLAGAREMVQRVVVGRERKLGTDHPDTVKSRRLLVLLNQHIDQST